MSTNSQHKCWLLMFWPPSAKSRKECHMDESEGKCGSSTKNWEHCVIPKESRVLVWIMLFSPADKITTKVRSLMFGGQDPSALNSDYIFLETTPLAALSGNYFASNSFKKQSFWIEQISYFHLIQIWDWNVPFSYLDKWNLLICWKQWRWWSETTLTLRLAKLQ